MQTLFFAIETSQRIWRTRGLPWPTQSFCRGRQRRHWSQGCGQGRVRGPATTAEILGKRSLFI